MQVLRHVHFADCVVPKVTKQEFLNDINLAMYDFKFTKYYVEKYTPNESKPPKDFTGTLVTCTDASANDLEEFSSFVVFGGIKLLRGGMLLDALVVNVSVG